MKFQTILFDFDGTLADTLPVCFYSFQEVFRKYDQREVSKEQVLQMFGPSEEGIIQKNLQCKDQTAAAIDAYYACYEKMHEQLAAPDPEVLDLLDQLEESGIQIGIVTGKARRSYELSVKKLFPNHRFEVSITGNDVTEPKPAPEGIEKAIHSLQANKSETLYVGDSNADIEAGKRAGVSTAGVDWLAHSHGHDFILEPDYRFNAIADFVKQILGEG